MRRLEGAGRLSMGGRIAGVVLSVQLTRKRRRNAKACLGLATDLVDVNPTYVDWC